MHANPTAGPVALGVWVHRALEGGLEREVGGGEGGVEGRGAVCLGWKGCAGREGALCAGGEYEVREGGAGARVRIGDGYERKYEG